MKVILIEEDRFVEILDKLKYEAERLINDDQYKEGKQGMRDLHRSFHYHLVRWMQSHGASCVR